MGAFPYVPSPMASTSPGPVFFSPPQPLSSFGGHLLPDAAAAGGPPLWHSSSVGPICSFSPRGMGLEDGIDPEAVHPSPGLVEVPSGLLQGNQAGGSQSCHVAKGSLFRNKDGAGTWDGWGHASPTGVGTAPQHLSPLPVQSLLHS